MTDEEVIQVMAPLTAAFAFAGHDDTITLWVDGLSELTDFAAAKKAAQALIAHAQDRYVPAWGGFLADYRRWAKRHEEDQGQLANYDRLAIARGSRSQDRIPSLEEGIEIAWVDYQDECARLGKTPNRDLFDSFLGKGREERKLDPRNNRGYNARRPFG